MHRRAIRAHLMNRWWNLRTPLRLQLFVGRVLCWFAGHEWTRYQWCDWCGKDRARAQGVGMA